VTEAFRIFGLFGSAASPASVAFPSGLRTQTNRAGLLFADVGPHFHEVVDFAYQIVLDRTICPSVGRASGAKDLIKLIV
jgi:hypothetical protein